MALKKILESTDDGDVEAVKKVKALYQSCLDTDTINARGAGPLLELIDSLGLCWMKEGREGGREGGGRGGGMEGGRGERGRKEGRKRGRKGGKEGGRREGGREGGMEVLYQSCLVTEHRRWRKEGLFSVDPIYSGVNWFRDQGILEVFHIL